MEPSHPLDRPVWSALSTRQMALSCGNERARRFAPEYGPLTAAASGSDEDRAALASLDTDESGLWLLEAEEVEPPAGMAVAMRALARQMVAAAMKDIAPDFDVVALSDDDGSEMLALAQLTRPGPFSTRTHRLGAFIGVRQAGKLVAMAGERLQPEGFAEVSGVCTHPEHRGHGHAAALSSIVTRRILTRGEIPFLHTYATNAAAIALYESLGFTFRREMAVTVLMRA